MILKLLLKKKNQDKNQWAWGFFKDGMYYIYDPFEFNDKNLYKQWIKEAYYEISLILKNKKKLRRIERPWDRFQKINNSLAKYNLNLDFINDNFYKAIGEGTLDV